MVILCPGSEVLFNKIGRPNIFDILLDRLMNEPMQVCTHTYAPVPVCMLYDVKTMLCSCYILLYIGSPKFYWESVI